jgi:hypothetical protein
VSEFFACLEHTFDEDGDVVLDSIERTGADLAIAMTLVAEGETPSRWRLAIQDVREHHLELGLCDSFHVHDNHPVLWPHVGPQGSLFFSKPPRDARAMIGRLWVRHQRETEGWIRFERFLNPESAIPALLEGGFGLLAKGPERLLRAYADELDSGSVPWSIAALRLARWWRPLPGQSAFDAGEWVDDGRPLKAITMGESYVVAANIGFNRY